MNYWVWYYLKPFFIDLFLLHARNVQLDFCVFEELCFALFLDSGFRIPAFRVAQIWSVSSHFFSHENCGWRIQFKRWKCNHNTRFSWFSEKQRTTVWHLSETQSFSLSTIPYKQTKRLVSEETAASVKKFGIKRIGVKLPRLEITRVKFRAFPKPQKEEIARFSTELK